MGSKSAAPSERTRLRRAPRRGVYERAQINEILDEARVCHIGLIQDGTPVVLPTLHVRVGDKLLLHGSSASKSMRGLAGGADVSVCVTLIDGLVLARSAFHHSINYRSVVIFGKARMVDADDEKLDALKEFVERLTPGRWADVRQPSHQELKATAVLAVALDEASAKVRTGPPIDEPEDYALDVWAGVIPLRLEELGPIQDHSTAPVDAIGPI